MNDTDLSSSVCADYTPSRSKVKQSFTASAIENLLKRKDSKKQFIVIENNLKKSSSTARRRLDFPLNKSKMAYMNVFTVSVAVFNVRQLIRFNQMEVAALNTCCAMFVQNQNHYLKTLREDL